MAILQVARMGNPILREVAAPVPPERFADPAFQRFCEDLHASMLEHDGIGLAAPQVFCSERVVVIQLDSDDEPMFLVNPVIHPIGEESALGYEGCLSVPDMRGLVARHSAIRVSAADRHGKSILFEAHGWAARVVQHECDHLDGVLYVDRAEPKSLAFLKEYRRYGPPVVVEGEEGEE